jgi:hypothetical protein
VILKENKTQDEILEAFGKEKAFKSTEMEQYKMLRLHTISIQ